jgi:hypothetical protein
MSIHEKIKEQAKLFVFDLNNSAKEHWFKPGYAWQVSLVTAEQQKALEKQYHPTLSAKALPEILAELLSLVKGKLNLPVTVTEGELTLKAIRSAHLEYLVAFNPERKR